MILRRVPPVHSPLPASAVARAAFGGPDPLGRLATLLSERFAADRVALCDSGTSALRIAIGLAAGDEARSPVALPAFGCFDIVTAAVGADVVPTFYDVAPPTLGPDFASLERALRDGARTIVAAHLYGVPVDWDRLSQLASEFDARVIEDAAMGHGGEWRGARLGSLGSLSILSFGRGKGWTGGGGGAVLARGDVAARLDAVPSLPNPGGAVTSGRTLMAALAQSVLGTPAFYGIPAAMPGLGLGETVYRPPGRITGMSATSARIALATMEHADRAVAVRRANAARHRESTSPSGRLHHVVAPESGVTGALRHPVVVTGGFDALGPEAAMRRVGIERSYPRVLPELEAVRTTDSSRGAGWSGARRLVGDLVTLPTHALVARDDLARIGAMLKRSSPATKTRID